jgi:hypothetical protein
MATLTTRSKLLSQKGNVSAPTDCVANCRLVLRREGSRARDHPGVEIQAGYLSGAALPAGQRQCAITAADIQYVAALEVARQAQQHPSLQSFGDVPQ